MESNPRPPAAVQPALGHSEDYFGSYRDFWWNADFVELMAKRLNWSGRSRVLEVGMGVGHWTRVFAPFLAPAARIVGIDNDPKWVEAGASWIKAVTERGLRAEIQQADVTALPFGDATFDFVTCQTVLIHLRDPQLALAEMLRVLRPGGLLLCVEPDNFGTYSGQSALSGAMAIDDEAKAFKFALTIQRGRVALGLGNLSLGGRLPGMFAAAGVSNIQVHLSDKTSPLYPPYATAQQVALIGNIERWYDSATDFSKDDMRKKYLAGGGVVEEFEAHWSQELGNRRRFLDAVQHKSFDGADGSLMYLVSGSKA